MYPISWLYIAVRERTRYAGNEKGLVDSWIINSLADAFLVLKSRFEPEHREHHHACQNARKGIYERDDQRVAFAVVVARIVARERDHAAERYAQGEKDLRGRRQPNTRVRQLRELQNRERGFLAVCVGTQAVEVKATS